MPKTVYAVSDSGHDYSSAETLGQLVFLYNGKINVFASGQLVKDIQEKLISSKPDDMLLPSGNALAVCIAFSVLMNKHGQVNHLIYSFRNKMFEVRTIYKSQIAVEVKNETGSQ